MSKTFTKVTEDFTCEQCGKQVTGSGYTNHCPHCLYSKHVDVNPGDRACDCGGLMQPEIEEVKGSNYTLKHTCLTCGHTKINKASPNDDVAEIIKLSSDSN